MRGHEQAYYPGGACYSAEAEVSQHVGDEMVADGMNMNGQNLDVTSHTQLHVIMSTQFTCHAMKSRQCKCK